MSQRENDKPDFDMEALGALIARLSGGGSKSLHQLSMRTSYGERKLYAAGEHLVKKGLATAEGEGSQRTYRLKA